MANTKERKALYGTLTFGKKTVKNLQAYYLQGGKWYKVKKVKGV